MDYLDEDEMKRAKMCVANVLDKIKAIDSELLNKKAYKNYILEKMNSIDWDITCLKSMCDVKE